MSGLVYAASAHAHSLERPKPKCSAWTQEFMVFFEQGSESYNSPSAHDIIRMAVENTTTYPKRYGCKIESVALEGHSSSVETPQGDFELSMQRSSKVREELVGLGIQRSKIFTRGYGAQRPAVKQDSGLDDALNRRVRVKITVSKKQQTPTP